VSIAIPRAFVKTASRMPERDCQRAILRTRDCQRAIVNARFSGHAILESRDPTAYRPAREKDHASLWQSSREKDHTSL